MKLKQAIDKLNSQIVRTKITAIFSLFFAVLFNLKLIFFFSLENIARNGVLDNIIYYLSLFDLVKLMQVTSISYVF